MNPTRKTDESFYRLFFSTALLSAPNAHQHGFSLYKTLGKKQICLMLASGLCLALHFFCWISSLSIISTFASTVIVCTQPVFVMAGAYLFFREKPSPRALPGVALCVAGTVIIALAGGMDSGTIWGSLLALLGALYDKSGATWRISSTLINKAGTQWTLLIYVLVGALLVYGGIQVTVMIFVLMSGLITPIASMPGWAQAITRLLPTRYFIGIMRAVYLKGTALGELWGDYAALAGFALVFGMSAILTCRKRT